LRCLGGGLAVGVSSENGRASAAASDGALCGVSAARFEGQLDKLSPSARKPAEPFLAMLEHRIQEKAEQRLNALDRLCACELRRAEAGEIDGFFEIYSTVLP
jgi:hypothetical protein